MSKLSNEEILDLVIELGIYEGNDADTLYREGKRLGLKKRKQKSKLIQFIMKPLVIITKGLFILA